MIEMAGSSSPKHAPHINDEATRRGSHAKPQTKSQQLILPSQQSNRMMRLAVEALARDEYAAGLVLGAFHHRGPGGEVQDDGETTCEEADRPLDAAELDAVMDSLLMQCVGHLRKRLWGGNEFDLGGPNGSCSGQAEAPCPFSRLLLALQDHVVTYWGNSDGDAAKRDSARDLSLAHAVRLLQQSLEIFARLLAERDQPDGGPCDNRHTGNGHLLAETLKNSFVSLVPALCGSLTVVLAEGGGFLTLAARLLPLIVPLLRVVDRFGRSRASERASPSPGWLAELEEALALLSSDLACGLIDMKGLRTRHRVELSPQETGSGSVQNQRGDRRENVVKLLLTSSPFLAGGHESFDWSGLEDEDGLRPDSSDLAHALEVLDVFTTFA